MKKLTLCLLLVLPTCLFGMEGDGHGPGTGEGASSSGASEQVHSAPAVPRSQNSAYRNLENELQEFKTRYDVFRYNLRSLSSLDDERCGQCKKLVEQYQKDYQDLLDKRDSLLQRIEKSLKKNDEHCKICVWILQNEEPTDDAAVMGDVFRAKALEMNRILITLAPILTGIATELHVSQAAPESSTSEPLLCKIARWKESRAVKAGAVIVGAVVGGYAGYKVGKWLRKPSTTQQPNAQPSIVQPSVTPVAIEAPTIVTAPMIFQPPVAPAMVEVPVTTVVPTQPAAAPVTTETLATTVVPTTTATSWWQSGLTNDVLFGGVLMFLSGAAAALGEVVSEIDLAAFFHG